MCFFIYICNMNINLKDWQIAHDMFGKNTKKECQFIKKLRKNHTIEKLDDNWSIIYDSRLDDDCGWLIKNTSL